MMTFIRNLIRWLPQKDKTMFCWRCASIMPFNKIMIGELVYLCPSCGERKDKQGREYASLKMDSLSPEQSDWVKKNLSERDEN